MNHQIERRRPDRSADEALSPEYLKVLDICGGEIRQSDRAALIEQPGADAALDPAADEAAKPEAPASRPRGLK
jgi:hypothetical protein